MYQAHLAAIADQGLQRSDGTDRFVHESFGSFQQHNFSFAEFVSNA
jgi:hypothetical protein